MSLLYPSPSTVYLAVRPLFGFCVFYPLPSHPQSLSSWFCELASFFYDALLSCWFILSLSSVLRFSSSGSVYSGSMLLDLIHLRCAGRTCISTTSGIPLNPCILPTLSRLTLLFHPPRRPLGDDHPALAGQPNFRLHSRHSHLSVVTSIAAGFVGPLCLAPPFASRYQSCTP